MMSQIAAENPSEQDLPSPLRTTLATEVRDILRDGIEQGRFEAGEHLTESRLAKQFNISRAPVREALKQLENQGMVAYFPHRGYFVRTLTLDDVEELFQLRTALEGLAVSLLISRCTDDDIANLTHIVEQMESPQSQTDAVLATDLDAAFHQEICKLSGNRRLLDVWRSMRRQIRIAVLATNTSFEVYDGFAEGHRAVLEAIKQRDVAGSQVAIARHLEAGLDSLRTDMEAQEAQKPQRES